MDAQKAVNLFKRTRTVATHRKAQRAVNLIHFQHSYERKITKTNRSSFKI